MLVSTNVLSLMQFVSTGSNHTAHMKAFIEQRHGLPLRMIVGLFLPDKDLNLLGKETADRGSTPCGENPHLLKSLTGQAYGHVLLGHKCRGRIWVQLFTYHTCSTYLTCRQA